MAIGRRMDKEVVARIRYGILLSYKKEHISGEGNVNPLQYSCLEKSMDRGVMRWMKLEPITE